MNGIELLEETSFRLLGLTVTQSMDWKPYIQYIAKASSRKVGSLYRGQHFLTPESILYLYRSTIQPCKEYCSHISKAWSARSSAETCSQLNKLQTFFWFASPVTQDLVPPKHVTVRSAHFSEQMHSHTVNFPMRRTNFYGHCQKTLQKWYNLLNWKIWNCYISHRQFWKIVIHY